MHEQRGEGDAQMPRCRRMHEIGATMNVIDIRGLTKRYGKMFAVDRLDMHVAAGDIYGFT